MRFGWKRWAQFTAGLAAALALARTAGPIFSSWTRSQLHDGWLLVRPPHEVSALLLQRGPGQSETLWAGGRDGLFLIDTQSGALLPEWKGAGGFARVRALLLHPSGQLFVAHADGISACRDGSCSPLPAPGGAWMALLLRRDGTLLAAGEAGLARFHTGAFTLTDNARQLALKDPDVLFEDSSRRLWVASSDPVSGGLLEGTPGGPWRAVHTNGHFPHPSISMVAESAGGALWFATGFGRAGGAVRWQDGQWTTLTKASGLAGEKVRIIYQDRHGRLWFGSEYDGIVYLDNGAFRLLTPGNGMAGWEVKTIAEDSRGGYWMGTENGITRMPPLTETQRGATE